MESSCPSPSSAHSAVASCRLHLTLLGKKARCPKCKAAVVVPAPGIDEVATEVSGVGPTLPPPIAVSPLQPIPSHVAPVVTSVPQMLLPTSPLPTQRPKHKPPMGGILLGFVGCVLLLFAFFQESTFRESDLAALQLENTRADIQMRLGGTYTYTSKNSDRTPVYVLASLGAIFVALGIICGVIETRSVATST